MKKQIRFLSHEDILSMNVSFETVVEVVEKVLTEHSEGFFSILCYIKQNFLVIIITPVLKGCNNLLQNRRYIFLLMVNKEEIAEKAAVYRN